MKYASTLVAFTVMISAAGCTPTLQMEGRHVTRNPISYFEIPVTDMPRAMAFYSAVFGYSFERETIDGYDMALFPADPDGHGASGALAKGDVYVPSRNGTLPYLTVESIEATLARATARNATILYPKKDIGAPGFVAEIEDSEGNRIALFERRD